MNRRLCSAKLTHEEVCSGKREQGQKSQRVLEGDGVLHCQEGHAQNERVQARARRVDAEHDEVAHVFVADAVPREETVVVPLEDHFLAQFAEVTAVQEVVSVHFVRAVGRAHWNRGVIGTFSGVFNSHYVVPQRVEHQEKEGGRVESRGAPQGRVWIGEDGWDEEAEVEDEGGRRGHEEVGRSDSVEEPQL